MIARLFLSLLLACLTLPALAMPVMHEMPAQARMPHAMAGMDHHAMPVRGHETPAHPVMLDHVCIGCIPPGSGFARMMTPHRFVMTPAYPAARMRLDKGGIPSPDTPPPKPSA